MADHVNVTFGMAISLMVVRDGNFMLNLKVLHELLPEV
jgi:hypothetical protein